MAIAGVAINTNSRHLRIPGESRQGYRLPSPTFPEPALFQRGLRRAMGAFTENPYQSTLIIGWPLNRNNHSQGN